MGEQHIYQGGLFLPWPPFSGAPVWKPTCGEAQIRISFNTLDQKSQRRHENRDYLSSLSLLIYIKHKMIDYFNTLNQFRKLHPSKLQTADQKYNC